MIIKKIAFGNADEAFVEDRLTDGFNIIYSDENNKGKTIVIQSALYALGNEPIFPSSFEFKKYHHYVEISVDNSNTLFVCRKGDSFIVKSDNGISVLDSVSELKRFLSKNGIFFPTIIKDNAYKIVDPVLLFQLFFVGQDKKDSSNIFNAGYYKKEDFWSLIYAITGNNDYFNILAISEPEIRNKIKLLSDEKKVLLEQNRILKKISPSLNLVFQVKENDDFKEKVKKIEKIRDRISTLKKTQNRALQRKTINENTLSEIRSLNHNNSLSGGVFCLECGSKRIGYFSRNKSYSFDISDPEMRRNILEAIQDKIEAYQDEIDECTPQINELQKEMQNILKNEDISLEAVLLYKKDIIGSLDADSRIVQIDQEVNKLNNQLKEFKQSSLETKKRRDSLMAGILDTMNKFYKELDPYGSLKFDDLFSKKNSVYSGCESTEFYLSKLYSLAVILRHNFPIIMDYFRDGELSTEKEDIVIRKFEELPNQIIFTATLKDQEYGKYSSYKKINAIDYSKNKASHILNPSYVEQLKKLLIPLCIRM
ncbi:hypothetical protein [Succinivibrio dextrinosolvens]|uniref:hypothetical protein n=1 Tax=Succinivibrio dextrinosolvens TaxID=83771 RepID=UPI0004E0FE27|nr:hypothetical protein [Succinivibrio dextrinosolvens]